MKIALGVLLAACCFSIALTATTAIIWNPPAMPIQHSGGVLL
jgi:hypothetical protein